MPRGRRVRDVRLRRIAATDDAAAPGGTGGAETSTSEGGGDGPEATGAGPQEKRLFWEIQDVNMAGFASPKSFYWGVPILIFFLFWG